MSTKVDTTIYVVDDDDAIRDALCMLLEASDLSPVSCANAEEFLTRFDPERVACILLDVHMPGMTGLELQAILNERKSVTPIIFITGQGDVPMAVEAIQSGAVDFLQKPFSDDDLLARIHGALDADRSLRDELHERRALVDRYDTLTAREAEVMEHVVAGKANKVIAFDLDVSQRTVEIHRSRVMEKMDARSLAHLVRMDIRIRAADA